MDLSVRELLVIIGVLLAVAVLLDGYRRMSRERRDTLRLSSKKRTEAEDELINPELPGGPARVVAVREQVSLHMRRADTDSASVGAAAKSEAQVTVSDHDILFTDPAEEFSSAPVRATATPPPEAVNTTPADDRKFEAGGLDDTEVSAPRTVERSRTRAGRARTDKLGASGDDSGYQELLVLNVLAEDGKPYRGADLLQILLGCDLRYGRMKIFHRHEQADGSGKEQFSVANLVEPGNFELDGIENFSTPGVVFFMNLPGPDDSVKAFDAMLETARCLVKNLGGELLDQSHSVATKQTLEHYKQRIRDFERRQMTLM